MTVQSLVEKIDRLKRNDVPEAYTSNNTFFYTFVVTQNAFAQLQSDPMYKYTFNDIVVNPTMQDSKKDMMWVDAPSLGVRIYVDMLT
jgi:hypothetical protein